MFWAWLRIRKLSKMSLGTPGFLLQSVPMGWHAEGCRTAESSFCLSSFNLSYPRCRIGTPQGTEDTPTSSKHCTALWADSIRWSTTSAARPRKTTSSWEQQVVWCRDSRWFLSETGWALAPMHCHTQPGSTEPGVSLSLWSKFLLMRLQIIL